MYRFICLLKPLFENNQTALVLSISNPAKKYIHTSTMKISKASLWVIVLILCTNEVRPPTN